jgi:hypothetical protein
MLIENLCVYVRFWPPSDAAPSTGSGQGPVEMNNAIIISAALWAAIIWAVGLL